MRLVNLNEAQYEDSIDEQEFFDALPKRYKNWELTSILGEISSYRNNKEDAEAFFTYFDGVLKFHYGSKISDTGDLTYTNKGTRTIEINSVRDINLITQALDDYEQGLRKAKEDIIDQLSNLNAADLVKLVCDGKDYVRHPDGNKIIKNVVKLFNRNAKC